MNKLKTCALRWSLYNLIYGLITTIYYEVPIALTAYTTRITLVSRKLSQSHGAQSLSFTTDLQ
jgi:hypothetical protein